ncbi:MAG: hypothetical protein H8E44_00595, partial [Planctomycetes bacterium]|nr:hypothetical protein [Planctomycetota bacterium]
MSDETQNRDVLYRIGVEAHPRTRSVLEQLAQQSNATQASMTKAAQAVGNETIQQIKRIVSARDDALKTSRSTAMVSGATAAEAKSKAAVVAGAGGTATVTATQQAVDRFKSAEREKVTTAKNAAAARVAAEKDAADQDAAIQAKRAEFLKKAEKARLVALKRT